MTRQHNIPSTAYEFKFVHASGPGGQHVNKTATAVEMRVRLEALDLPPAALRRLSSAARNRINRQGELIIQCDEHRSQLKNRKQALQRLQDMVDQSLIQPKARIATRPSAAARRKRLDGKKMRGQTKAGRRKPSLD